MDFFTWKFCRNALALSALVVVTKSRAAEFGAGWRAGAITAKDLSHAAISTRVDDSE